MKSKFLAFSLLVSHLFIISCSAFVTKGSQEAELHMRIGIGHMQRENYPQALSELLTAESLDPESHLIQNNLSIAYSYRDRFDLAEKHALKALELAPQFTEARVNLSRILIERSRYDEAYRAAKLASEDLTYPNPERPLLYMGIARFKQNQYKEAHRILLKAIENQRDNCLAQSYFGRSLFEMNEYSKASEALDRASSFCQKIQFDEPQYYAGFAYFQLGEKNKAENRLESLLKLYPNGRYTDKAKNLLEQIRR